MKQRGPDGVIDEAARTGSVCESLAIRTLSGASMSRRQSSKPSWKIEGTIYCTQVLYWVGGGCGEDG